MKLHFTTWLCVLFLFLSQFSTAQIPVASVAKSFGGSGSDGSFSVRTYPNGESILVGEYVGSVTLNGVNYPCQGGYDAFVAKLSTTGDVIWSKIFTGTGDELLTQIALDPQGNAIVVGQFSSEATFAGTAIPYAGEIEGFLAKLDSEGNILWTKTAANSSDADYQEVDVDDAGNIYAFGTFKQTISFSSTVLTAAGVASTNDDLLIVKYTPTGEVVWAKNYGNSAGESAIGIWVNSLGECTLTGSFLGLVTIGNTQLTNRGLSDIYLIHLNAEGDPAWSRSFGGTRTDNGFGITGDAQGNIYATGSFYETMAIGTTSLVSNGEWDIYAAKFLPDGTPSWAVSFGGTENDRCNDIRLDVSGNVFLCGWYQNSMAVGSTTLTSLGLYDVFLIKLQGNGEPNAAFSFGGNSFDTGAAMDFDAVGNIYLSGNYWSQDFSVGTLNLTPISGNDIFFIKLGNQPTGIYARPQTAEPIIRSTQPNPETLVLESNLSGWFTLTNLKGQVLFNGELQANKKLEIQGAQGILPYRFQGSTIQDKGKLIAF